MTKIILIITALLSACLPIIDIASAKHGIQIEVRTAHTCKPYTGYNALSELVHKIANGSDCFSYITSISEGRYKRYSLLNSFASNLSEKAKVNVFKGKISGIVF